MKVSGPEMAQRIGRLHPKITDYLFMYADAADTRRKLYRVKVYFILYEEGSGLGIDDFIFYIADGRTPKGWAEYLRDKGIRAYATRVLASKNVRRRREWRLVKMLAFVSYRRMSGRRHGSRV